MNVNDLSVVNRRSNFTTSELAKTIKIVDDEVIIIKAVEDFVVIVKTIINVNIDVENDYLEKD